MEGVGGLQGNGCWLRPAPADAPHRPPQAVTGALGWRADRLTLTAEAGVVVIRRDPSGLVTLRPGPASRSPRRCGLLPGDPVLLTAVPAEDTLTAYSLAVVDQALAADLLFPLT